MKLQSIFSRLAMLLVAITCFLGASRVEAADTQSFDAAVRQLYAKVLAAKDTAKVRVAFLKADGTAIVEIKGAPEVQPENSQEDYFRVFARHLKIIAEYTGAGYWEISGIVGVPSTGDWHPKDIRRNLGARNEGGQIIAGFLRATAVHDLLSDYLDALIAASIPVLGANRPERTGSVRIYLQVPQEALSKYDDFFQTEAVRIKGELKTELEQYVQQLLWFRGHDWKVFAETGYQTRGISNGALLALAVATSPRVSRGFIAELRLQKDLFAEKTASGKIDLGYRLNRTDLMLTTGLTSAYGFKATPLTEAAQSHVSMFGSVPATRWDVGFRLRQTLMSRHDGSISVSLAGMVGQSLRHQQDLLHVHPVAYIGPEIVEEKWSDKGWKLKAYEMTLDYVFSKNIAMTIGARFENSFTRQSVTENAHMWTDQPSPWETVSYFGTKVSYSAGGYDVSQITVSGRFDLSWVFGLTKKDEGQAAKKPAKSKAKRPQVIF